MSISAFDKVNFLRSIILFAYSTAFSKRKGTIVSTSHHEKEGMCFAGKPLPKTFELTPTTVPVLNMVLMPHLE